MDETEITRHIQDTFVGVDVVIGSKEAGSPEVSWGDTFFFFDPEGDQPKEHRFPFATIVTKDYEGFDTASNLNRPGVFRLNLGVSREKFRSLFEANESNYDFAALDRLMPHPVYGKMFWVCILNPSAATFEKRVRPLLAEAYNRAADKEGET